MKISNRAPGRRPRHIANVSADPNTVMFPTSPLTGKAQRSIYFRWPVRSNPDGTELIVELSCVHTSGFYLANLNNGLLMPDGSIFLAPNAAHPLLIEPVSRYYEPTFKAFAVRALVAFRIGVHRRQVSGYLLGQHEVQQSAAPATGEQDDGSIAELLEAATGTGAQATHQPTADLSADPVTVPRGPHGVVSQWIVSSDDNLRVLCQLSCSLDAGRYVATLRNIVSSDSYVFTIDPWKHFEIYAEAVPDEPGSNIQEFTHRAIAALRGVAQRPEVQFYLQGGHHTERRDWPHVDVTSRPTTVVRSGDRNITFWWTIGTFSDGTEVRLNLTCCYVRHQYIASLSNEVRRPGGGGGQSGGFIVAEQAVKRYSDSRLRAFANRALERFLSEACDSTVAGHLRGDHVIYV